jgi:fatty-acyl-CoA synthase
MAQIPSPGERRAALEARFPVWEPRPMHRWLERIAEEFPDREFVVTDERSVTYSEMVAWSRDLAAGLASRGIGKGDHVAVLLANCPEFVALKYGISALGAVMVPVNTMYLRHELAFLLKDSRAKALITVTGFRGQDYLGMLDDIVPGWDSGAARSALPDLTFVAQFETATPGRAGVPTVADIAALGRQSALPDVTVAAEDVSVIFYTSGTTGSPKGVLWSHDAEARVGYGATLTRAFGDGWRTQSALPMFHAFANNEAMHAALFAGGAYIPRQSFDVEDFVSSIERHRPNEIETVPTMLVALCESERAATADTSSLVGLMCAGAPAPAWLWQRAIEFFGVQELTTGFGMTETGAGPVMSRPEMGIEHVASTVGQPKMGGVAATAGMNGALSEVRTADPQTGEILPDGVEGELISRGPTNALGYWNRPEATAETFRDGWVYTGDVGKVLPDGSIVLTGRKKEMIRTGGENFAPKEVEELLTRHPAVSTGREVGRDRLRVDRPRRPADGHRRGAHRVLPGQGGGVQAAPARVVHRRRRSAQDSDRQGPEVRPGRDGRKSTGCGCDVNARTHH